MTSKTTQARVRRTSIPVSEFLKNPTASVAKVKNGQQVVLIGSDGSKQATIYPGALADYSKRE